MANERVAPPNKTQHLEGRVPPCDLGAEAAVLSWVLTEPVKVLGDIDFLKPHHFYSEANRQVYAAACWLKLHGKTDLVDVISIAEHLKTTKRLGQVGGMEYINGLLVTGHKANNSYVGHAQIVYERWRLREAILAAQRIAVQGFDDVVVEDVQAFIDRAVQPFIALSRDAPASVLDSAGKLVTAQVTQMVESSRMDPEKAKGKLPGLPTGLRDFDRRTGGMALSAQTLFAAQQGHGKSTFGLQVAIHNAGFRSLDEPLSEDRVGVIFFTGEMTKEEQADRMTGYTAKIEAKRVMAARKLPTLTAQEWQRVMLAKAITKDLPFWVSAPVSLSLSHISTTTRQAIERGMRMGERPIRLVVVDYIQRMELPAGTDRKRSDEQHSKNAEGLTELAKATGCAFLVLAQLNAPDPRTSPSGRPYQNLISYSRGIEREANQVFMLWRPDKKNSLRSNILITKGRNGTEGEEQELGFDPIQGRMYDPAWEQAPQSLFEDL